MSMRSNVRRVIAWAALAAAAGGCGGSPPGGGDAAEGPPLGAEDRRLHQQLMQQVSAIINEESTRYTPLQYEYNEGLLDILDRVEPFLSGEAEGEPPRFMTDLDAEEELDHLRETARRWEAKTGDDLRAEIDRFKEQVALRRPGQTSFSAFHSEFSKTFDAFIAIEVEELRERANRAIHARAEAVLAPHRESSPEVVRRIEAVLNAPPYALAGPGEPGEAPAAGGPGAD